MTRPIALLVLAILLATGTATLAADRFPANGAFTNGARGWTLPEGARIAPADGATGSALTLGGGWAISDPCDIDLSGWQAITIRARATGGAETDRLLLALPAVDQAPSAQAAITVGAAGQGWREIVATLPVRPGPVQLAVGSEGAATWSIDSITLAPAELPGAPETKTPAIIEDPLPPDWEPDGLLDGIERRVGGGRQIVIAVGALTITLPPEVTAERGHRGALRLSITTRATSPRELTVSVTGPPGFFAPRRTVNIRPGADTVFQASLQAFFVGQQWARVTFSSGGDEASVPVLVNSSPTYPAAGAAVTAGPPPAAALAALSELNLQLIATRAPSSADQLSSLPARFTRLLLLAPPWAEEALRSTAASLLGHADFMALYHPREDTPADQAAALTRAVRNTLDDAEDPVYLLSPPLDLQAAEGLSLSADGREMVAVLARANAIAAPALRLPVVEARAGGTITVDRRANTDPQPVWQGATFNPELDAIVETLRQEARLPIFFADIAGRTSGSEIADAMALARLLTHCVYQGATGFAISARPADAPEGADAFCMLDDEGRPREPVASAVRELARELSGAAPLRALQQSKEIGLGKNVAVGFRPFMRGDEGLLALWNNTPAPIDLIFEVRTEPLDLHTVSIGLHGVRRDYLGSFHFSEDAIALNRPVVFVTLAPQEFQFISMQLARPHAGWLAAIERKPPIPDPSGRPTFLEDWERRFAPPSQRIGM